MDYERPRRRVLPVSLEAEQGLIGCMLVDSTETWEECPVSKADLFYPEHRIIFEALLFIAPGKQITCPMVMIALAELGTIDTLDLLLEPTSLEEYLITLMAPHFSAKGMSLLCARTIKDYAERRRLIEQGAEMVKQGYQGIEQRPGGYE